MLRPIHIKILHDFSFLCKVETVVCENSMRIAVPQQTSTYGTNNHATKSFKLYAIVIWACTTVLDLYLHSFYALCCCHDWLIGLKAWISRSAVTFELAFLHIYSLWHSFDTLLYTYVQRCELKWWGLFCRHKLHPRPSCWTSVPSFTNALCWIDTATFQNVVENLLRRL